MWLEAWGYEVDFGSYRPQGFTEQEWKGLHVKEPDFSINVPHGWTPQAWFEYQTWMRLGFPVRLARADFDDENASAESDSSSSYRFGHIPMRRARADVDDEAAPSEAASDLDNV